MVAALSPSDPFAPAPLGRNDHVKVYASRRDRFDDPSRLPRAAETVELRAERGGRVTRIGCRAVGHAAMLLGAGRERVDSRIDPAVGLVVRKKVGDPVEASEPLVTVHVNDRGRLAEVLGVLRAAIDVGAEAVPTRPLIHDVLE